MNRTHSSREQPIIQKNPRATPSAPGSSQSNTDRWSRVIELEARRPTGKSLSHYIDISVAKRLREITIRILDQNLEFVLVHSFSRTPAKTVMLRPPESPRDGNRPSGSTSSSPDREFSRPRYSVESHCSHRRSYCRRNPLRESRMRACPKDESPHITHRGGPIKMERWSARPGSNRRPLAWEANALPTELLALGGVG